MNIVFSNKFSALQLIYDLGTPLAIPQVSQRQRVVALTTFEGNYENFTNCSDFTFSKHDKRRS